MNDQFSIEKIIMAKTSKIEVAIPPFFEPRRKEANNGKV